MRLIRFFLSKLFDELQSWSRSREETYCQLGLRRCRYCREKARQMERA